jgi:hypothetical protein
MWLDKNKFTYLHISSNWYCGVKKEPLNNMINISDVINYRYIFF